MFQISFRLVILVAIVFFFGGCRSVSVSSIGGAIFSPTPQTPSYEKQSPTHLQAVHRATFRSYNVFGVQYCPHTVAIGQTMSGIASWYGPDFHGKKTSSGEIYNKFELTAAHKTWPMHTVVRVDNLENGKSVVVRINDRGPFLKDRVIDLSYSAAHRIDMHKKGLANVRVTVLQTDSKNWSANAPKGTSTGATSNECHLVNAQIIPPVEAKTLTMSGDEIFLVQVASFSSFDAARTYQQKSLDLPLTLDSKIESRGGLYRILVGGFKNEGEARDFIANSKHSGAFLVRERR